MEQSTLNALLLQKEKPPLPSPLLGMATAIAASRGVSASLAELLWDRGSFLVIPEGGPTMTVDLVVLEGTGTVTCGVDLASSTRSYAPDAVVRLATRHAANFKSRGRTVLLKLPLDRGHPAAVEFRDRVDPLTR